MEFDVENACKMAMQAIKKCITQNDYQNAEKLIEQYLIVKSDVEARQFAALIKMNLGKYQEAKEFCLENLRMHKNAEDYTNVALIEKALHNMESSLSYAKYAYELKPNSAAVVANYAIIAKTCGKHRLAKVLIDRAIELDSNSWMYIFNKASLLSEAGKLEDAKVFYEKALKINPLEVNVNIDYFYCLAKLNLWKIAWPFYEYRYLKIKSLKRLIGEINRPVLQIKQDIYSQNICIIPEQGMGDNLMFLRFIKIFQTIAPNSYFLCPESLIRICEKLGINYKLEFDQNSSHVISIMSLPYHLNIEKIPEQECIFAKNPQKNNKLRLGICWAGSPFHPMDKDRSTYMSYFDSFLRDDSFEVYSFQKDTRPRKYSNSKKIYDYSKNIKDYNIIDLSQQLSDGFETAKFINDMDVFIAVDSYPIHLAGITNTQAYVLVGNQPDWRWSLKGEKSEWYSNITVVRKDKRYSYKKTINDLHKKIRDEHLTHPLS